MSTTRETVEAACMVHSFHQSYSRVWRSDGRSPDAHAPRSSGPHAVCLAICGRVVCYRPRTPHFVMDGFVRPPSFLLSCSTAPNPASAPTVRFGVRSRRVADRRQVPRGRRGMMQPFATPAFQRHRGCADEPAFGGGQVRARRQQARLGPGATMTRSFVFSQARTELAPADIMRS